MSIKFDRVKLLENIAIGKISFLYVRYGNDYFGMEDRFVTSDMNVVYYDATRDVFFTKEIYGVFLTIESLIKFYSDNIGEVRSYRDSENDLFFHDLEDLV